METDLLVLLIITIFLILLDAFLIYIYIKKELKARRLYYGQSK